MPIKSAPSAWFWGWIVDVVFSDDILVCITVLCKEIIILIGATIVDQPGGFSNDMFCAGVIEITSYNFNGLLGWF